MQFSDLVSNTRLLEARLAAATREDAPARTLSRLLRDVADLNDRLERHEPRGITETREMIAFFASRGSRGPLTSASERDLDTAIRLANRKPSAESTDRRPVGELGAPPSTDTLARGVADPDELMRYIGHSSDRLIALNHANRYMAVTAANARFNNTTRGRMIDLHLEEVIGKRRYLDRAAPALDRVTSQRQPSDYTYVLPHAGTAPQFMRCEIIPIRDRAQRFYCSVIRMSDITRSMVTGTAA